MTNDNVTMQIHNPSAKCYPFYKRPFLCIPQRVIAIVFAWFLVLSSPDAEDFEVRKLCDCVKPGSFDHTFTCLERCSGYILLILLVD